METLLIKDSDNQKKFKLLNMQLNFLYIAQLLNIWAAFV